jgi:hypothetical protein
MPAVQAGDMSLSNLRFKDFEYTEDLEVCLQWVGNKISSPDQMKSWMHSLGYAVVQEKPARYWVPTNIPGIDRGDLTDYHAQWRKYDNFLGRPFPLSIKFNLSTALFARNLITTLVVHKQYGIIDVSVGVIRL